MFLVHIPAPSEDIAYYVYVYKWWSPKSQYRKLCLLEEPFSSNVGSHSLFENWNSGRQFMHIYLQKTQLFDQNRLRLIHAPDLFQMDSVYCFSIFCEWTTLNVCSWESLRMIWYSSNDCNTSKDFPSFKTVLDHFWIVPWEDPLLAHTIILEHPPIRTTKSSIWNSTWPWNEIDGLVQDTAERFFLLITSGFKNTVSISRSWFNFEIALKWIRLNEKF